MTQRISSAILSLGVFAALMAYTLVPTATQAQTVSPKMKMTTDIPAGITTPDSVQTRLGTLKFFDGFPDDVTVEKVYDNLDFERGVQAFLTAMPGASVYGLREGFPQPGCDRQSNRAHHRKPDGLEVALPHSEHRD